MSGPSRQLHNPAVFSAAHAKSTVCGEARWITRSAWSASFTNSKAMPCVPAQPRGESRISCIRSAAPSADSGRLVSTWTTKRRTSFDPETVAAETAFVRYSPLDATPDRSMPLGSVCTGEGIGSVAGSASGSGASLIELGLGSGDSRGGEGSETWPPQPTSSATASTTIPHRPALTGINLARLKR